MKSNTNPSVDELIEFEHLRSEVAGKLWFENNVDPDLLYELTHREENIHFKLAFERLYPFIHLKDFTDAESARVASQVMDDPYLAAILDRLVKAEDWIDKTTTKAIKKVVGERGYKIYRIAKLLETLV